MGIFDIFRKKEVISRTIDYKDINDFIKTEEESLSIEKIEFLNSIIELNSNLTTSLKNNLDILRNADIEEKKLETKIAFIVKQNLNNYIFYTDKLIYNLEELSTDDPIKYYEDLNSIIFTFEKRSSMAFEKATFVFGELGKIRELLDSFFLDLKKIIKEHTDFINKSSILNKLSDLLKDITENQNIIKQVLDDIKGLEKELIDKEHHIEEINQIIENIKSSENYQKYQDTLKLFEEKSDSYKKQLFDLKSIIDFKSIGSILHSSKDSMEIINHFKTNFIEAFNDDPKLLLDLLNDSKFLSEKHSKKYNDLLDLKDSINNIVLDKELDIKIDSYNETIKTLKHDIISLSELLEKEHKKPENYKEDIDVLKDTISNELLKLNIKLLL